MKKNVLVISASSKKGGNSDLLADQFLKGSSEAGNPSEKIRICDYNIKYCTGCMTCSRTGFCIIKDDMTQFLQKMVKADVIVFATPVYFFTMNGQLKTLIDRCCPVYTQLGNKDYRIIMSAGEDDKKAMQHVLDSFDGFFDCLDNVHKGGVYYGLGINAIGEVQALPIMQEVYEAGKNI